jgi:plastocyanin
MVEVETAAGTTWRRLANWAAITAAVVYIVVMATAKAVIPPIVIIFLVLVVGVVLLRRGTQSGIIVTLVGFVLFLLSDVIFGGGNFSSPRSFPSFWIALAGVITGVVGITATVAMLRHRLGEGTPMTIARVAGALIVVAGLGNLIGSLTYKDASRQAGDIAVAAKDTKFGPNALTVSAGRVTFFLDNKDVQLHNFHIKGVGPAVLMPASHRTRHTFALQPGTYSFVCDFHTPDMKGTITVR